MIDVELSTARTDKNGIPISRTQKNHSITFKEELDTVYIVENWKIHNGRQRKKERHCCDLQ